MSIDKTRAQRLIEKHSHLRGLHFFTIHVIDGIEDNLKSGFDFYETYVESHLRDKVVEELLEYGFTDVHLTEHGILVVNFYTSLEV